MQLELDCGESPRTRAMVRRLLTAEAGSARFGRDVTAIRAPAGFETVRGGSSSFFFRRRVLRAFGSATWPEAISGPESWRGSGGHVGSGRPIGIGLWSATVTVPGVSYSSVLLAMLSWFLGWCWGKTTEKESYREKRPCLCWKYEEGITVIGLLPLG